MKLIYITTPNKSTATNIAQSLIKENLAACVNILGGTESHYIWNGSIECSKEIIIFVKTASINEQAVIRRAKELHPYEVPCIISLEINSGNLDFINYVNNYC